MQCARCGRENIEKALICYWCGMDPATGELPYAAPRAPDPSQVSDFAVPEVVVPPAIEVPSPMAVPGVDVDFEALDVLDLRMPEIPVIEIAPPPEIVTERAFTTIPKRRARYQPVVRPVSTRAISTRPLLPAGRRLLVFLVGLGALVALGSALVTAVGVATVGNLFCLAGLFGVVVVLWVGALFARTGRSVAARAGVVYERLESLGQVLREVVPGMVKEWPVNLPANLPVLDVPVGYSELRALTAKRNEPPLELAVDLITGAIASLVGRDDVVLARRTFPVHTCGLLTRQGTQEINVPVLTRRHAYVGPGELEAQVARRLRTDRPMTVAELVAALGGPRHIVDTVVKALEQKPPDLEALASPDQALVELRAYRDAIQQADPELYKLLEAEVRRALGRRAQPSSLLDLARYALTSGPKR